MGSNICVEEAWLGEQGSVVSVWITGYEAMATGIVWDYHEFR